MSILVVHHGGAGNHSTSPKAVGINLRKTKKTFVTEINVGIMSGGLTLHRFLYMVISLRSGIVPLQGYILRM